MSYGLAYKTQFYSLDNTLWELEIAINGYNSNAVEIKLDGEDPCTIEWQESKMIDVVQSSTCTVRVSNESDRQMVRLMDNTDATLTVKRNRETYWLGHLDDAVYEEPYSYATGYVTELVFTDFGRLNRLPYTLNGKQCLHDIVIDCLASIGYNGYTLYTSFVLGSQPLTLNMLHLNSDLFAESKSWGQTTKKREVLEELLRPLGLRIMQKNGAVIIYDIEYLRDHNAYQRPLVWKGNDAYLRGSETFGWFEVSFDTDTQEILADDGLNYDAEQWQDGEKYFANCYIENATTDNNIGFYIETSFLLPAKVQRSSSALYFRTRSALSNTNDVGVLWRGLCKQTSYVLIVGNQSVPIVSDATLAANTPVCRIDSVVDVLQLTSGYLPLIPEKDKYQLRLNVDFLLSFRPNPFDNPPDDWSDAQPYHSPESHFENAAVTIYEIPTKLELLDDNGNVIYHYRNADYVNQNFGNHYTDVVRPYPISLCGWVAGEDIYGEMFLAYYKDNFTSDILIKDGWLTNRMAASTHSNTKSTLYSVRNDGEYISLPPVAGRLRLTIGNGVFITSYANAQSYSGYFLVDASRVKWQAYKNIAITLVRAARKDDAISTDGVVVRDMVNLLADSLGETNKVGSWCKGIAPSARGLLFSNVGNVLDKLTKNGETLTLAEHRLRCLEDYTRTTRPVLSGTAELDPRFGARRESLYGVMLVTALRQNLHQGVEEVIMSQIAANSGIGVGYNWGTPICVRVAPIDDYSFSWDVPICVVNVV